MAILKRVSKRTGKPAWQVLIDERDPLSGKRKRLTVGTFATKKEAQREEANAITQRERGTLLSPDRTTVAELLDRYLEVEAPRTVRPEGLVNYEWVIRTHLKPALGALPMRKLTVEHVDRLYRDMQSAGYSSSTIKAAHLRLSAALKLAKRWGIVSENVCDYARAPTLRYRQSRLWTPDELRSFLGVADSYPLAVYWRLLVESGARTSELLGITWDDYNCDAGTLRLGRLVVRLAKGTPFVKEGGKSISAVRTLKLTSAMQEELHHHRVRWLALRLAAPEWENEHGLMFCSPRGRPLNARNVRRSFDRLVAEAGVPPVSPHSLRKLHITAVLAAGGPVRAVQARVGHASPDTTLGVYAAVTTEMEDRLVEIVKALVPHRDRGATTNDETGHSGQ